MPRFERSCLDRQRERDRQLEGGRERKKERERERSYVCITCKDSHTGGVSLVTVSRMRISLKVVQSNRVIQKLSSNEAHPTYASLYLRLSFRSNALSCEAMTRGPTRNSAGHEETQNKARSEVLRSSSEAGLPLPGSSSRRLPRNSLPRANRYPPPPWNLAALRSGLAGCFAGAGDGVGSSLAFSVGRYQEGSVSRSESNTRLAQLRGDARSVS